MGAIIGYGLLGLYLTIGFVFSILSLYGHIVLYKGWINLLREGWLKIETNGDAILFVPKFIVVFLLGSFLYVLSIVAIPIGYIVENMNFDGHRDISRHLGKSWKLLSKNIVAVTIFNDWWNKPINTDELKEKKKQAKISKLKQQLEELEIA